MIHFKTTLILILTLCTSVLHAQFSGGDGTEANPYQISSYSDLETLSNDTSYWSSNFIQTADIDASSSNDGGAGFLPIGYSKVNDDATITKIMFTGNYDGDNHIITNLFMDRDGDVPVNSYIGLFGYTSGSTIKNIGLENVSISGRSDVGALIGQAINTAVTNCYSTGTLIGTYYYSGGLIGKANESDISNCYSSCDVKGFRFAGGLTGDLYYSSVSDSYASGDLEGIFSEAYTEPLCFGGFSGTVENSTVTMCYATGDVSKSTQVGGFVGDCEGANNAITKCYATGNVSGYESVGGFAGRHQSASRIEYCYATGNVSATDFSSTAPSVNVGGFVGKNYESFINHCYCRGNVEGITKVGGFAGYNEATNYGSLYGSLQICYSTGSVSGTGDYVTAFCAYNNKGTVDGCYWDKDIAGTNGVGFNNYSFNQYDGLTTSEMQTIDSLSFRFAGVKTNPDWAISTLMNDGYPVLFWQIETTSLAELVTLSLDSSTDTTATLSCTLTSIGMPNPAKHGFCYSTTNTSPTISDSNKNLGDVSGSTQAGTSFTGTIENLDSTQTYYIRAYATNYSGSVYSNTVTLESTVTGLSDIDLARELKVYPNPTSGNFWVEYDGTVSVSVYTASGQKLLGKQLVNKTQISLKNSGIYFLVVQDRKICLSSKIVITSIQ